MDTKVLEDLVKARKALKKKFRKFNVDKEIEVHRLEDTFKPITEPLRKFIDISENIKRSKMIKDDFKNEHENFSNSTLNQLPIKFETSTPKKYDEISNNYDSIQKSLDKTNDDFYSQGNTIMNYDDDSVQKSLNKTNDDFYSQGDTTENYNTTINPIDLSQLGRENNLDTLYGPHKDSDGEWQFGNSNIKLTEDKIEIGNQTWLLTPGLFELLFHRLPKNYDKTELEIYKKILMNTNAYKRDYKPDGQIKGTRAYKYQNIIKQLFKDKTSSTATNISKNIYQGSGINTIQETNYVYWNDANELVDRLRILIELQVSGQNNNQKEITAIIKAMQKADLIM